MLLYQPQIGYCYNSDSIFLYDFISSFKPKKRVLDVGAGCGIVGLLLAKKFKNIELEAVEKQPSFVAFAAINAAVNGLSYKIFESDFLEFSGDEKYDFIVSNPPFYNDGAIKSKDESLFVARYSHNLPLNAFFKKVSQLLNPSSHFIFCYEASQFGLICAELERCKMRAVDVRFVHSKSDKKASLVLVHARNSSKALMNIMPPLIVFDGGVMSQEAKNIYDGVDVWSIKCQA